MTDTPPGPPVQESNLHRLTTSEPPAEAHYVDQDGYLVDQEGRHIDDEGYLLEPGFAVPALSEEAAFAEDPSASPSNFQPAPDPELSFDRLEHDGPDRPPISRSRHLRRKADQAGPALQSLVDSVRRPRSGPDYVELPVKQRSAHKLGLALLVVFGLLVVAAGGGYVWYRRQVNPPGGPGARVAVDIPQGASTSGIAGILESKHVISNAAVFQFYVSNHNPGTLQAGHLVFRRNSSFDAAIKVLKTGPPVVKVTKVTIPEGFTLAQIEDRLVKLLPGTTKADLDALMTNGKVPSSFLPPGQASLEGLLFPATYDITPGQSAQRVLTEMSTTFDEKATALGLVPGAQALTSIAGQPISPYQVVTVASLIQSEAGSSAEMPKIATVIYNRIRLGMPLGIDATSKYEASLHGSTTLNFESKSPYNTRRVAGIPPTPISSPGQAALDAAIHPAPGPWTYYVLQAPGQHFFTDSPAAFNQAVTRCRAAHLGC